MARIFLALALFSLGLLGTNLAIGLSSGDLNAASHRWVDALRARDRVQRERNVSSAERQAANSALAEASRQLAPIRRRHGWHVLCGIAAALTTVLVNSIAITYFVGTSRWCREVVDAYRLSDELSQRSQRLKRRTFPWALLGVFTILTIVALGAVSDPGANFTSGANYVTLHLTCAVLGIGVIAWAFWVQLANIGANYEVIDEILAEVRRIQAQRQQPLAEAETGR